ncbi:MAG: transporter substrate-binding domain-containing protein [Alcaligenaceae bacterium]|nr:transporter substrate-binding domain-containing protein [Alcaligenaceae bacterium]
MVYENTNSGFRFKARSRAFRLLVAALGLSLAGSALAASESAGAVTGGSPPGGPAASPAAVTLGMSYVVPPHVPGSKVRTPEGLAPLLAERLHKQLPVQAVAVPVAKETAAQQDNKASADALLLPLDEDEAGQQAGQVIPTGYRAGIMAIMRTDTDIHSWDDLRGRTVCLAEGSTLAGQMETRYGAIEKVFQAPADALLDLRFGGCDAAVHDSTMLEALLQFPEWQKFSARLPIQQERDLAFIVPDRASALAEVLQEQVRQWQDNDILAKLTRQAAQDIAFEVYMDQEVPDCH